MPYITVDTPTGPVTIIDEEGAIASVSWASDGHGNRAGDDTPLLQEAARQVTAYFTDPSQGFDLPLRVEGSDFQRAVCDAIAAIPFGQTRTYGDLAKELGAPPQAIGTACGGNPIPVIIPCHRVLGANGLGGFSGAGGVETKVALLRHEGAAGLLI